MYSIFNLNKLGVETNGETKVWEHKKALSILLVVLFVLSVTSAAENAKTDMNNSGQKSVTNATLVGNNTTAEFGIATGAGCRLLYTEENKTGNNTTATKITTVEFCNPQNLICDGLLTLPNWCAFSYTFFSIIDYVLNCSFQHGRIYFTYLFPYRSSMTERLERGCAHDSVSFCSPRICYNIHAGKNCRVFEFLCVIHKIRFHEITKRTCRAVKHYNNWLRRLFYQLFPSLIINLNHKFVQSLTPVYYRMTRILGLTEQVSIFKITWFAYIFLPCLRAFP